MAAFLGLIPTKLLSVATIAPSTNTFKYLVEENEYSYSNLGEEAPILLEAVCWKLNVSKPNAENIVCKFVSAQMEGIKRYVDSIYPHQAVYIYKE